MTDSRYETPRVDAFIDERDRRDEQDVDDLWEDFQRMTDLARTLERELQRLREQVCKP